MFSPCSCCLLTFVFLLALFTFILSCFHILYVCCLSYVCNVIESLLFDICDSCLCFNPLLLIFIYAEPHQIIVIVIVIVIVLFKCYFHMLVLFRDTVSVVGILYIF
jgi:hypothetical protein